MLTPTVNCDVLLELQALVRTVRHPDCGGMLQAQYRSLLDAGGADATVRDPVMSINPIWGYPGGSATIS